MKHSKLWLLTILLCHAFGAHAQIDTEFWFAAPQMSEHTKEAGFHLMFFAYGQDANITISQPANPAFSPQTCKVYANSYYDMVIAGNHSLAKQTLEVPLNQVSDRGLLIQSDAPIGCYYQITAHNGEAFTLKGHNALGTDFCVGMQTRYANGAGDVYTNAYSSVQIVATEDNTLVQITPSKGIFDGTTCSDSPYTVLLNKGETYAFRACGKNAADHLAGTRIRANKPVAVTGTDDSVAIGGQDKDAIGEQLLPTDFAGTEYAVVSQKLSWEGCFIQPLYDNTTVTLGNGDILHLNTGDNHFISLAQTEALYISADQPIQVFQITGSGSEAGGTTLPQLICTGSKTVTYKRIPESTKCIINLLTKTGNIHSFSINGNEIDAADFHPLIGTDGKWSYARLNLTSKPVGMPLQVSCTTGVFQMGVVDFCGNGGQSCTYGFFSDYSQASYINVEANQLAVDSSFAMCTGQDAVLVAKPIDEASLITWTLPDGSTHQGDTLFLQNVTSANAGKYLIDGESNECEIEQKAVFLWVLTPPDQPTIDHHSICEGESYTWALNGKTYTESVQDTVYLPLTAPEGVSIVDCDSAVILHLVVHPHTYMVDKHISTTPLTWIDGKTYTESTSEPIYTFKNANRYGCDSIVRLDLQILDCMELTVGEPDKICGDDAVFSIPWSLQHGEVESIRITYDDIAHKYGFQDDILTYSDTELFIPLPTNVYANSYHATLHFSDLAGCQDYEYPLSFLVHYPSSVFTQKWNDVLALYNEQYNRGEGEDGYRYTAFQWYKNNEPIAGATSSWYYAGTDQTLDFSAEYSVLLSRADGTQIMTCPMRPVPSSTPDILPISLRSSLLHIGQNACIQTDANGSATLYNAMGNYISTTPISVGDNNIALPRAIGIYLLIAQTEHGHQTTFRLIVR